MDDDDGDDDDDDDDDDNDDGDDDVDFVDDGDNQQVRCNSDDKSWIYSSSSSCVQVIWCHFVDYITSFRKISRENDDPVDEIMIMWFEYMKSILYFYSRPSYSPTTTEQSCAQD